MTDTYTADARFEDGQWQATVRGLRGAHTYARTVEGLRKRLREVIVLIDDRADDDVQNENAFTVGLAFDVHVTDDLGTTDSVSVTVRPATIQGRGHVHEPRVTVIGTNAVEVDEARAGQLKVTPAGSIELRGSVGEKARQAPTGSIELHGTVVKKRKPTPTGSIELHAKSVLPSIMSAAVGLSNRGTLAAGAAPHEAVAYAAALRERAEAAEAEADQATRVAVLIGLAGGMSMRDLAALLGISHQRVSQIAGEEGKVVAHRRTART